MHAYIFIWYTILLINLSFCEKCDDKDIQKLCLDQENCDDCLQADACCSWCYDEKYNGRKCNLLKHLECNEDKIEKNTDTSITPSEDGDKDFSTGNENAEEIIQLKPQQVNISLRKGVPVNFTFTYKPAVNYPLELYYLGDLSVSMKDNLIVFKTIGRELPDNLTQLTKNYKLAYGSFLDKTGMPFYFTDPTHSKKPCLNSVDNCEAGYLFKHRLSFTKATEMFVEKITNSKITANLDDLDGALDAILQILVCGKIIGWSTYSRKIILLPTDSLLHTAGDGILVGAVLQANETCLLDKNGDHIAPLLYDYPSVGQIDRLLKDKKVNIIFAVKDKMKLDYYRKLTENVLRDSAFTGELEADSRNILDLITKGFYNFARQVSFSVNTSMADYIDVKYFGDCDHLGTYNETGTCYNIESASVNFKIQLTLKNFPSTRENDILYIEEKNIYEKILLNISYHGQCKCKNYQGARPRCINGEFRCGECVCNEGWTGDHCDITCDEHDNYNSCRYTVNGTTSKICSLNGDCICGKCNCNFPFEGAYCQYLCPLSITGQKCSGLNQGKCYEGRCVCLAGFTGEDCSCSTSTKRCKLSDGSEICSAKGDCVCNKCNCIEGFSGQYCEKYRENNTLCEDYKVYVEEAFINGTLKFKKGSEKIVVDIVKDLGEQLKQRGENLCRFVIFKDNFRCTASFFYYSGTDGAVHLPGQIDCIEKANIMMELAIAIIVAIVVGGLLMVIIYKIRIYRIDKAEYKKFEDERKNTTNLNPIYKNPVTMYRNPMLGNQHQ